MTNRLSAETSPYLLQHQANPVDWWPWSAAALGEARRLDRAILLSVGYAACHWCHVMAHESFENPEIAALINRLFVPIKVDREERPDLDAIYQQALAMLGEQGGWPLTMFLTPAGEPFWGGTYYPPVARWGRPGLPEILETVADTWRSRRAVIDKNVMALTTGLRRVRAPAVADAIGPGFLDQIATRLAAAHDPVHGGLKGAPKFPNCSILELLWRTWRRTGDKRAFEAVWTTLERMSQGGIYDHLGGGYARYSTDERWLAPHFEKMLYDNAQILGLLTALWLDTGNPLFHKRADETVGWLAREMVTAAGGFAGTIDADSEHEEGAFYVWTEAEIDRLLGADAGPFKRAYDVDGDGNWEGKTILNRLAHRASDGDPAADALGGARAVLLAARAGRIRPDRDDKILADWNGLMIEALSGAASAFGRPDWLDLAVRAWRFVTEVMQPEPGRLVHSWRLGQSHPGTLDDHAAMARAGLGLYEATGEAHYLAAAEAWMATLDRHFANESGAYYFTPDDGETLVARLSSAHDAAVPSGNGVALAVLARLHHLTGRATYRERADRLLTAFAGELPQGAFGMAALLNGADTLWHATQIVVVGRRRAADTEALLAAVYRVSIPARSLLVIAPGAALPAGHPAEGRDAVAGQATAYVCHGTRCSLPVTDPGILFTMLRSTEREGD